MDIFLDEAELKRLEIQGRLLREYEQPVYQQVIAGRRGLTLLDVGCNDGRKTKDRFSGENFSKIVGVDCLEPLIGQARRKLCDEVFSFHVCDVSAPDFADKLKRIMQEENISSFDVIHCSFLLMHLENPVEVLRALREVLAADGTLLVIEPDDTESFMQPDTDNVFSQFLEVLAADPYSGKRNFGGELPDLFLKSGYSRFELKKSEVCASGGEFSKKEDMFTTFCSYLPEDLKLLKQQKPEHPIYQWGWEWVQNNFEKLHEQMISEEVTASMGVKIYTCGGA